MIICPNCGKDLADGSQVCQFCGSTLTQIKPSTSLEGKVKPTTSASRKTIILSVTAVILAIAVIITGIFLFVPEENGNKKENDKENKQQKTTELSEETLNESTTKRNNIIVDGHDTSNSTSDESATNNSSDKEYDFENSDSNDENNFTQTRRITSDTPSHAGVNLRKAPSSESELIMVLPEGTEVFLLDEMEDSDSYWKVSVKADGKEYTGYVLERYVSTFTGVEFSYRVCYSTPDHAGVVLRSEASASSDKIIVLPEGTELRVWSLQDGSDDVYNETYWSVDAFYNGTVYKGYVLQQYIEEK